MASAVTKKKRERVYLACRAIFAGPKAQLRKKKLVVQEIQDHRAALASLSDIEQDEIIEIVRDLLEKQVFELDLKARLHFPKLFQASAERDALREASELDAAQSAAEILEEVATDGEENGDVEMECEAPLPSGSKGKEKMTEPVNGDFGGIRHPHCTIVPTLHPVRLPYKAQHVVLCEVQTLLEECFYDFARKWLPALLEEEKCDCALAIELTIWSHLILHRLKLTGADVRSLVAQGAAAAAMLRDLRRAAVLEALTAELGHKISSMALVKNDAERTAVARLEDVRRRREALDREEEAAVAEMLRRDADATIAIGMLIEESVGSIWRAAPVEQSGGEEEDESDSDEDDANEAFADAKEGEDDGKSVSVLELIADGTKESMEFDGIAEQGMPNGVGLATTA
ncbi:hypothetical protein KJ359_003206 [Pestalotiopsis sp. 9143b]|nr:hypothetical protein KJ359_003206 [Pestalotiopsis sp. 9143b]